MLKTGEKVADFFGPAQVHESVGVLTAHQVNGNFPAFGLLNVLAIEGVGCTGGKNIVVTDKCISPDPAPGP